MMPDKATLRRMMRARLPLAAEARAEKSALICRALAALPEWHTARTVALFAPQVREPDIDGLWLHAAGKVMAYPRMEGEGLALYAVGSPADLIAGRWGVREPAPTTPVRMQSVDLVLVPGVAFTLQGARCGRGGGFYDRFLASLPSTARRVGVCFGLQLVPEVPMEPHDLGVDIVVTEQGAAPPRER